MKFRIITSICASLLLIFLLAFLVNGCKKQSESLRKQNEEFQKNEEARKAIGLKIQKEGIPITIPLNQKLETFYSDKNGIRLSKTDLAKLSKTASINSACDYGNVPSATVISYTLWFDCLHGYKISWKLQISTNNNLVLVSDANPNVFAKGFIKITDNSDNSKIYSSNAVTGPAELSDQGIDPDRTGFELFWITYKTDWISNDILNRVGTYSTGLGGFVPTDCSDIEPVTISMIPFSATEFQAPSSNPLERIDPIYYASTTTGPFKIWGEDPTASICDHYGYVYPSLQEIQLQIDGSGWIGGENSNSSLSYFLPPSGAPFSNLVNANLGYVDPFGSLELQLTGLSSGNHNIQVKYRNLTFNHSLSYYGSNWPIPVTAGDDANCDVGPWSNVSSFTVAYD